MWSPLVYSKNSNFYHKLKQLIMQWCFAQRQKLCMTLKLSEYGIESWKIGELILVVMNTFSLVIEPSLISSLIAGWWLYSFSDSFVYSALRVLDTTEECNRCELINMQMRGLMLASYDNIMFFFGDWFL